MLFIWKSLNHALPRREAIYKRTGKGDITCKDCGKNIETVEHIFFSLQKSMNDMEDGTPPMGWTQRLHR